MLNRRLKTEALNTLLTLESLKALFHFTGKSRYYDMNVESEALFFTWLTAIDFAIGFFIREELLKSNKLLPSNLILHYAIAEVFKIKNVDFKPPREEIKLEVPVEEYEDTISKFIEEFKITIAKIIIKWKKALFLLSRVYKMGKKGKILLYKPRVVKSVLGVLRDTTQILREAITTNDISNELRKVVKKILEKKAEKRKNYYRKEHSFEIGQTKGIIDVNDPTKFDAKIQLNIKLYFSEKLNLLRAKISITFFPVKEGVEVPSTFDAQFLNIWELKLIVKIKLPREHIIRIAQFLQKFIIEEA